MSLKATFSSNSRDFNRFYNNGVKKSLFRMSNLGVSNIKTTTPVDTGNLRGSIFAKIGLRSIFFIAPLEYAKYVEFGTYRTKPQPFMRRGIARSIKAFTDILIRSLRT